MPMRPDPASISCVIPCHNEAANLPHLVALLQAVLPRCTAAWEIVVVDDGSRDDPAGALAPAIAQGVPVRVVELSRNFGKEAAISAGLVEARGQVVVLMDGDLQHPPVLIESFVQQWREGADVVLARRSDRADEPWSKRLGTRVFYRLINVGHRFEVPEDAGDFRLMDRAVVDALNALPERDRFMKGLYAWAGFRTTNVPYLPPPRAAGRSNYRGRQLLSLAASGLTAFTNWPLRMVSVMGLLTSMIAILYGAFLVVSYLLWGHPLHGWTTIVVAIMLLSGMQMLSLGILGEYVGRIFEEVKQRPLYVVRQVQGRGLAPAVSLPPGEPAGLRHEPTVLSRVA